MFELWLFTADIELAKKAVAGGVGGIIIDWEHLHKYERQQDTGFDLGFDAYEDLVMMRKSVDAKLACRVNHLGPHSKAEIETAIAGGADLIFLPMVKNANEVGEFIDYVGDKAKRGILLETKEAIENCCEIAKLPVDFAYVGLNDLSLSRRTADIFTAVADGTVEFLRGIFKEIPFGFGGVTVTGGGHPIPSTLLLKEMSRLNCDFGFLRRSFKKDIIGKEHKTEVEKIINAYIDYGRRGSDEMQNDRLELVRAIEAKERSDQSSIYHPDSDMDHANL